MTAIKNMTHDAPPGRQAVADVVKGVTKKTFWLASGTALGVLVLALFRGERWWFEPISVLFGGLLGLVNFRWLALSVERIYLRQGANKGLSNVAAIFVSLLKLSVIFIVLFVIIKWRFLHILSLVAGLSTCFLAILWEGATVMKHALQKGTQ